MVADIISELISATNLLLVQLTGVFGNVVAILYDGSELTELGTIVVATAGFALAWAGIRFVFGFVNRLLNKSRAGR